MAATCEDCGTRLQGGRCPNCHEETFIRDQYIEQGMKLPDPDSDFMKDVSKQEAKILENQVLKSVQEAEEFLAKERNRKRWPQHYD